MPKGSNLCTQLNSASACDDWHSTCPEGRLFGIMRQHTLQDHIFKQRRRPLLTPRNNEETRIVHQHMAQAGDINTCTPPCFDRSSRHCAPTSFSCESCQSRQPVKTRCPTPKVFVCKRSSNTAFPPSHERRHMFTPAIYRYASTWLYRQFSTINAQLGTFSLFL